MVKDMTQDGSRGEGLKVRRYLIYKGKVIPIGEVEFENSYLAQLLGIPKEAVREVQVDTNREPWEGMILRELRRPLVFKVKPEP